MNGQKMVLVGLVTLVLATFLVTPGHAVMGWYTVTVTETGPAVGTTPTFYARITYVSGPAGPGVPFTNKYVKLHASCQKEMLAVMLTAMASNMKVLVQFNPDGSLPFLYNTYLK